MNRFVKKQIKQTDESIMETNVQVFLLVVIYWFQEADHLRIGNNKDHKTTPLPEGTLMLDNSAKTFNDV